jgi:peptidoglycan/LPS O-acetylase OafA/YrhL
MLKVENTTQSTADVRPNSPDTSAATESIREDIFSQRYLPSLDGLRALSILVVIGAHISHSTGLFLTQPWTEHVVKQGVLGVHIFFVISGFLITTLLIKEKEASGGVSLRKFYIRRGFRILPVLLLYFLLIGILGAFFPIGVRPRDFAGPLFFLGNFHNFNPSIYFAHFWSLAYEEQFYFVIPFLLSANINRYYKGLAIYLAAVPLVVLGYGLNNREIHSLSHALRFISNFYPLALGSFVSIAIFKHKLRAGYLKKVPFILSLVLLVIIFAINTAGIGNIKNDYWIALANMANSYLISAFILICICSRNSFLFKVLNNKASIKIGVLSYSLYVFQQVFTTRVPWSFPLNQTLSIILNLLILVVLAFCSYTYYESAFLRIKNKFK